MVPSPPQRGKRPRDQPRPRSLINGPLSCRALRGRSIQLGTSAGRYLAVVGQLVRLRATGNLNPKQGKVVIRLRLVVQLALFGLLSSAVTEAKERNFSPISGVGQEVRFSDGDAILVTGNTHGNIAANLVPLNRKWALLNIWIENASERQFNISEGAFAASSNGNGLVVLSYLDRQKAEKRKQVWAAVATGLAAGLNSYNASNAGYSSYSGSYRGSTTSAYGTLYSGGSYYGTSYSAGINYLAQANAAAQNQAMFDRYEDAALAANRNLQQRALKANTLAPGQSIYGDVQIMLPKAVRGQPSQLTVTVLVGGEPLTLNFGEGVQTVQFAPSDVPAQVGNEPGAHREPYPVEAAPALPAVRPALSPDSSVEVEAGRRRAEAFAHPSGAAARVEFTRMNCLDQFSLVSSRPGKAIFEATCGAGDRRLLQCQGAGCSALN